MQSKWTTRLALGLAASALFVAAGGPSYAASTAAKINGSDIKSKSISGSKLKNNTITSGKVKNGSLLSKDFKSGQLPKGDKGDTGAPGTARAYAQVDQSGPTLIAARTKGFSAVTRPSTGVYCLTPSPAIDPEATASVASPEFGSSALPAGFVDVRGIASNSCPAGQFAVHTLNAGGTAVSTVSFFLIVP